MNIIQIPLDDIFADPEFNCRGHIAPIDVVELARSIDSIGLQQPISVQPYDDVNRGKKYRVVLGHRRFEAFKLLSKDKFNKESGKYQTIPATVQSNLSELDARALNLTENLERKDLNIMQEAKALLPFIKSHWNQQDIASRLNQSTGWVQIRLAALKLEPEIQQEIAAGYLTQQQIKDLLSIPSKDGRFSIVREIKDAKLRGEKATDIKTITKKKEIKQNPNKKAYRLQSDMFKMQDHIRNAVGNNIGTRALAWAAGTITDLELFEDIADIAKEKGVPYEIPPVGLADLQVED